MKIFGILSDERALKTKSPALHTAVLRKRGIHGIYLPFVVQPARVGEAVRGLLALGIAGANVTVPYKQAVMPHLDRMSEAARAIGAVNTIVPGSFGLEGDNTDADGFADSLNGNGFNFKGASVLLFGAGGASKAVVYALKRMGVGRITMAGRDDKRVGRAARGLEVEWVSMGSLIGCPISSDLIVNTTSVSSPRESEEMAEYTHRLEARYCRLVYDLNYGRSRNFWRDLAEKNGCRFMDGLPMLAHQACRSFNMWTRAEAKAAEFIEALEEIG